MRSSVDLPLPDGPTMQHELAGLDFKGDVVERVDLAVLIVVHVADVLDAQSGLSHSLTARSTSTLSWQLPSQTDW